MRETLCDNVNFLESGENQIEAVLEDVDIKTEVIETGTVYESRHYFSRKLPSCQNCIPGLLSRRN